MNPDIVPVEDGDSENVPLSLPIPLVWWGRVLYGLFVTITPVIAFAGIGVLKPEWQNGKLESYIVLFLLPEASLPFLLLLAYSVVCYLFFLAAPLQFSRSFLYRLGIYAGVLLALQYTVITLVWSFASSTPLILPIWISPFILILLYRLAIKRWTSDKVNQALLVLVLIGILIGIFWSRGSFFFLVLIGLTLAAPFWSFLLSLRAAIWLFKNHETKFTLPHGLGLTVWLAGYVAAWRFGILKMYELYNALPPAPPPDCYIATAAAKGHPSFVGSQTIHLSDGKFMQANHQLRVMKCAELAIMIIVPNIHKPLRMMYDMVGKPLAYKIQNPFLADIAYLSLKPAEWLATCVLKIVVPEMQITSIYETRLP